MTAVDLDALDAHYEPKAREYGAFYIEREDYRALIATARKLQAVEALIDPEAGMATGNGYDSTRLFEEKDIRRALDTSPRQECAE